MTTEKATENPYLKEGNNYTPEALNEMRLAAKAAETAAKNDKVFLEEAIIAHPDTKELPRKGTTTLPGLCKVVTKDNGTWDQKKLAVIRQREGITDANWPFKIEYKEVASTMKYLRENYPEYIEGIEKEALSLKPAKPSFQELKK